MAYDLGLGMGEAIGGLLGFMGTKSTNIASAQQADKQMAFQERMSSTAHQRQVADLRKAGLNPILSSKYGGSSTPGGAMAQMKDPTASAVQAMRQRQELSNMRNQNQLISDQSALASIQSDVAMNQFQSTLGDAKRGLIQSRYYQSKAGKAAYLAQLAGSTAKSILNPLNTQR